LSVASRARYGEFFSAGTAIAARMPMMVMTTNSSSKVNPAERRSLSPTFMAFIPNRFIGSLIYQLITAANGSRGTNEPMDR